MMIKQKLQSAWNWTKDKARRFWKWGVAIIIGGVVLAAIIPQGPETGFEFLIRVENAPTKKMGNCVTFKEIGWSWGSNERKHYAIIKIPDITYEQAKEWCSFEDEEVEIEIRGVMKTYRSKKYKFDLEKNFPDEIENWLDQEKEMEVFKFSKPDKLIKKK